MDSAHVESLNALEVQVLEIVIALFLCLRGLGEKDLRRFLC